MANKWAKGEFIPKNPEKYHGKGRIIFRSSWEANFMHNCDINPAVLSWTSESVRIPYRNPLTGKMTTYVPDFLVLYVDKNGQKHAELIEIKPAAQATMESAGKSMRNKAAVAVNTAKWIAAKQWCKMQGIEFRVVTEHDLFHQGKK
jgi:hypothetical protein